MANSFKPMHKSKHFPIDQLVRVGNYELSKTIGTGNFAIVKLGTHVITKSKVAIKIIDKSRLDEDNLRKTFREIAIMKRLRHPHVVGLYQVMESAHSIYLVTEYVPNGELFDYLTKGRMPEPSASRTFAQIVAAVGYCHASGIVHRDLKAENLLLDKQMNIKLADFGFSNEFSVGSPLATWCGSPPYAAPELFEGKRYDGPKADIWSLGVVLYVLVCGVLPFDGFTMQGLRSVVLAGKFRIPYFLSQDCEHLLRHMLVVDPERRLSLRGVGRHRWLDTSRDLDISTGACACHPLPRAATDARARETALDHMASLPGLTRDEIVQAINERRFDHITAIYDLLIEKMHSKKQTSARSSLSKEDSMDSATGQPLDLTSCKSTEDEEMDAEDSGDATCLVADETEYCSDAVEKFGSADCAAPQHPPAPRAAADHARRHTVGPQDCSHKQALELTYPVAPAALSSAASADGHAAPLYMGFSTSPHVSLLPHTNLAAKLPAVQDQPPRYFSVKDQHLLKPPHAMQQQTSTFGRRASDGGAHVPRGRETSSCRSAPPHHVSDSGAPPRADEQEQTEEQNTEYNSNLSRYMLNRGSSKRHTMATTEDAAHAAGATAGGMPSTSPSSATNIRTRRTGLLTVTERPPVISPDLVMEVEARMKRNYLPPSIQGGYQYQMSDPRYQNSPPQNIPQSPGPSQKNQLKPMLPTIPQGTMMENQSTVMGNQSAMIGNQSTMMGNQSAMTGNQNTMIGNQSSIMGNQNTMMGNQRTMMDTQSTANCQSTMMSNQGHVPQSPLIGNQGSITTGTPVTQAVSPFTPSTVPMSPNHGAVAGQSSPGSISSGTLIHKSQGSIVSGTPVNNNYIGDQNQPNYTHHGSKSIGSLYSGSIVHGTPNVRSTARQRKSDAGPMYGHTKGSITAGTPHMQSGMMASPPTQTGSMMSETNLIQNSRSVMSRTQNNQVLHQMMSAVHIGSTNTGSIMSGTPMQNSGPMMPNAPNMGQNSGSIMSGTPNMMGMQVGSTNTGSIMCGTPNLIQNSGPMMSRTPNMVQNSGSIMSGTPNMMGMQVGSTNTGSIMSGSPNMIQNSGSMLPNMIQNSGSIMSGTPNMMGMQIGSTNTGSIMSGTPNTNHMRIVNQNPSYMMQGSPNMMQGSPNMMQGSPNMMQASPIMMQRPPNTKQGPPSMMQGQQNMMQIPPNMMQGQPNMMQNSSSLTQGSSNIPSGSLCGSSMQSGSGSQAGYNARQRKYSGPQRGKHQMLATVQEMAREHTERYSPVRRASESSPPRGAHDIAAARLEYQQLQRGLDRRSTSAVPGASPPLAEPRGASASAPGSPRRVTIPLGSVELPPLSCEAARALLRAANTLGATDDDATTAHITQELATKLGINVHALNLPNVNASQEVLRCLQAYNYNNSFELSALSHYSGPASPCSPHHQQRSPLHQITEGLSFLHTGASLAGSITRGTAGGGAALALHRSCNNSPTCGAAEPLHMIQEEIGNGYNGDSKTFQTHPQISLTDCLGSEITLVASSSEDSMDSLENHSKYPLPQFVISEPSDLEHRPSITKGIGRRVSQETEREIEADAEMLPRDDDTDRLRDEAYPRRGSDKSLGFSDDSLSNDSANVSPHCEHNVTSMYSNIVSISSGFSENRGSFSENRESFSDRGSFSERGDFGRSSFSERSDLGRSSFSAETPRSSFSAQGVLGEVREYYEDVYMPRDSSRHCLDACLEEGPIGEKIQIVQSPVCVSLAQECYEVPLSSDCSQLDSRRIVELVRQAIAASQVPPQSINVSDDEDEGLAPRRLLSLEYSDGIQIELLLCEDKAGQLRKVMRMRRVSGDQLAYGNLCQQLIHSLT